LCSGGIDSINIIYFVGAEEQVEVKVVIFYCGRRRGRKSIVSLDV
jgi:7-cyano-7-deazaguanine synthase in queuosine biosynthesis